MATILIVDDQPTNRMLLTTLLGYQQHRLLQAVNGFEALTLIHDHHPDLVVTDLLMPEMDGFVLAHRLRADSSTAQTRVVFYTANYLENEVMALARTCGVRHFLPKPSEVEVILKTVDVALHEIVTLPDVSTDDFDHQHLQLLTNTLLYKVKQLAREPGERESAGHTRGSDILPAKSASASLKCLTPRQREILQLIAGGHSTQEIAIKLFISVKTVETHRAQLMDRLDIHNVAGLVRYAIRQGLLTVGS